MGGPPVAEAERAIVELEPVAGADVGAVVGEEHLVEAVGVHLHLRSEPHQPHHPARRFDPLEGRLPGHPRRDDGQPGTHVVEDRRKDGGAMRQHRAGDALVEGGAADEHLLLGGEEPLGHLWLAAHHPADAQPGKAVGLRHRRDAERRAATGWPPGAAARRG